MEKYLSPKYIIIALLVVTLGLGGILIWQLRQKPVPVPEASPLIAPGGQIIFKPWSKTAERYYPGGGNAIDFRDGAEGDFEIKLSKKGEKIVLDWPTEIKITEVKVYNLGELWDLQDHFVTFNIANFDISAPPPIRKEELSPEVPEETREFPLDVFPQPEVYILPPYPIGEIPEGFFDNTFYTEKFPKGSAIFEKGGRYSVELYGINPEGKYLSGYYTFNYE